MFRAALFSVGLFVTLCGAALACVDRIVLTDYAGRRLREAAAGSGADGSPWRLHFTASDPEQAAAGREVLDPPDWAAFAILSAGGVTMLYAVALPGRRTEESDDSDDECEHEPPHHGHHGHHGRHGRHGRHDRSERLSCRHRRG